MTTTDVETLNAKIDALSGAMAKIDALTGAVHPNGSRLSRQQLAGRLGIHRNTLSNMLARDRPMPRPGKDGKWLLADIIKWESERKR